MNTPQTLTQFVPHETGRETNRFLFIASDYKPWPGGIAAYLDTLARGLMSLGDAAKILAVVGPDEKDRIKFLETYEPWVAPFQMVDDDKPANWLGRKCVSVLEILRCLSPNCRRLLERASLFKASTAAIERLEQHLSDEKPTMVIFGHLDVKLYALALPLLERQLPYGIIAHGREVGLLPKNKINDLVIKKVMLRGANWIAANSRHTKALLEIWGIPSEKLKLICPPMSEDTMRESAVFSPVFKKDDNLCLVTICRLVEGKGVNVVLRALRILAARGIPFRYVIGGEGPERNSLEALANELGLRENVHFEGFVTGEEKWRLLRNADVFVMPSQADSKIMQEGFGIAFVEAAAFAVPAIGSKSGGIPDAVVDGETGLLVPEDSPVELADALTFLYRSPESRKEMGRAARERAMTQFSPMVVAARFREGISKGVRQ